MSKFIQVAKKSEIAENSAKCVDIEGKRIALFNLGGEIFAIDDVCTHSGGPLSEGTIEGDAIECPWHGARFSIRSGDAMGPPAYEGVAKYNVRVLGDAVEIEM